MPLTVRRSSLKDWVRAVQIRWRSAWGTGQALQQGGSIGQPTYDKYTNVDYATSNDFPEKAQSADGQSDYEVWRVDSDNALRIGGEARTPMPTTINFPLATNGSITTQCFFIAPFAMKIVGIACRYGVTDGAANTGWVTHETGTQAAGAGNKCMNGTFNLNSTANVTQYATLPQQYSTSPASPYPDTLYLAAGDRLSFKINTAVTSLAGLVVSIAALPGGKGQLAVYNMQANGDLTNQSFFLANRGLTIQGISTVWGTKSSSGTSTLDVQKDTGTTAPGSGTSVLASTIDVTATANTVTAGALAATTLSAALTASATSVSVTSGSAITNGDIISIDGEQMSVTSGGGTTTLTVVRGLNATAVAHANGATVLDLTTLTMAAGDRLSVKFAGAGKVALAGVVVVVWFTPIINRKEISWTLAKNANIITLAGANQAIWQNCDGCDYEVIDASEVHSTLGTDAGNVNVAVEILDGITAPGSGTLIATDNTNRGFNLKGTINTVQIATLGNKRNLVVKNGSALSLKFAGTQTAVAGVTVTVSLRPRGL